MLIFLLFWSFEFRVFEIALRLPVVRISLYDRPLRMVSSSNHFGFCASAKSDHRRLALDRPLGVFMACCQARRIGLATYTDE